MPFVIGCAVGGVAFLLTRQIIWPCGTSSSSESADMLSFLHQHSQHAEGIQSDFESVLLWGRGEGEAHTPTTILRR